jgi:hypothetical protein
MAEMSELGWGEGGAAWAWEEELLGEFISVLANFVLQTDVIDRWVWRCDPDGGYSVRGVYKILSALDAQDMADTSALIWHKQVPLKVSVMVWRLLRNRLPTKDNLVRRHIIPLDGSLCVTGCESVETTHVRVLHPFGVSFDLGLVSLRQIRQCFMIIFFSSPIQ